VASVLDWLDDPAASRGIHFAEANGGWQFQPYTEIARDAQRVATLLVESGARPGDVVSLLVAESTNFVPAFLGTALAGMTPSPIASPVTFQGHYAEHVAEIVSAADPAVVLVEQSLEDVARQAVRTVGTGRPVVLDAIADLPLGEYTRADAPDVALLQFTSGSSGTPKGVRITPDNLAANVAAIRGWLGVTPDDSCASWLPLYHDMGLIGTFLCSVVSQVDLWQMTPVDFIRSPLRWLECHGRHGVTITTAPNFGYGYTSNRVRPEELDGMDFSSWRAAMNGAERIDPKVAADFAAMLAPHGFRPSAFAPCYGLAEATVAVSGVAPGAGARIVRLAESLRTGEAVTIADKGTLGVDRPEDGGRWLTACGAPVPGTAIQIIDEDGTPLPEGHFGEIQVQGTSVAAGYQSSYPGASSNFTADGLRTGDSGFVLDGDLFVVGRVGDSLKIRGRKVHAEDLETTLTGIPGIPAGRCVVALGNSEEGDHAVVIVEAKENAWLESAVALLRSVVDDTVHVSIVKVKRGTIPRTSSGKPRRRLIWRQFQEQELAGDVIFESRRTA
jgi:acyl-CoA synthetase (AMP-forming)/AMP-acid ligase II